ncbi:hypothetical protein EJB05_09341, partial [Eragrostis curvula]
MTSSSSAAAAAIPAAPSSTLSPHAAPYTLRARQVCAPTGRQQDGDASRLIDENLVLPTAYFGMKSRDAAYPISTHGMHQSQPSSSAGVHVNAYPSSASSSSGYSWMASDLMQELFPWTSGNGRSGIKSKKVTIKCPPNRTLETSNTSFGSKGKLAIRENGECNNEAGKDISFRRNLEFSNPADDSGSSQGTLELNPALKHICIPPTHISSCVSVADDVNPDPSECSVDSPCYRGTLASRVSSFDVLQTPDALSVKQESVDFDTGRGSTVQNRQASTGIENLVSSKSKQNLAQPQVEAGLLKRPGNIDTNSRKVSHGKELEHAKHGALKCNAEQTSQEVRNNCMKRSGLNSAAPDFIPSSVRKTNTGIGLPSSIVSNGSCSSTGRNTSGILKEIKSLSEELHNIELEEHDHSLLLLIIENLQSYLDKARKGPVKVASAMAGLKARHSQDAASKSVAVNHNDIYSADNRKGIIISNIVDYGRSRNDFGRNSLTGYQPASNHFGKELSYEDEHSQVHVFKNLWIDAERANCTLKYQLKQTRMEIGLESSIAHIGGGPTNPSLQLWDKVTDPSCSVGHALTCSPMLNDHPGSRRSSNLICVGDCIHSGDSNIPSISKDYVTENNQGKHFLSDLEETGISRGLQLVNMGLNSRTSDGVQSHSYITGRDDILRASCEFGLSEWEHVLKDEIP